MVTPLKGVTLSAATLGIGSVGVIGTSKLLEKPSIESKIKDEKLEEKLITTQEEWQKVIDQGTTVEGTGAPSRTQRLSEFIQKHSGNLSESNSVTKENLEKACQKAKEKPSDEKTWSEFKEFCMKLQAQ